MAVQGTIKKTAPPLRLLVGTLFVVLFCREGCSARLHGAALACKLDGFQQEWLDFRGDLLSPNQQFTTKQHHQLCRHLPWPLVRKFLLAGGLPLSVTHHSQERPGHTEGSEHCSKLKALPVTQHRTVQGPAAFLCSGCAAPFTSKPHLVQPFLLPGPFECNTFMST